MYDCIRIKTDATAEFIVNVLASGGVKIKRIEKSGKGCVFFVKGGEYKNFCGIMERYGKDFTVIHDGSKSFFIKKNIGRIGIYLGLIVVVIGLIFFSTSVTRVKIGELKWVKEADIYSAVMENAVLPAKKSNIDCEKIKKAVISLEGISSASVELKGNTIFVNVYEELEKVEVIDKSDYTDILSNYDGIVTRVIVYSGAATVKTGDTVKRGQTLISSDIILDEENGLIAKEKPLGEIYGRVWVTKNLTYYPTVIEKKRTGKAETVIKAFAPPKKYKGKFKMYDTEIEQFYLNSVIPIKMYKATYYEVAETEREFDFDANSEGVIKDAIEDMEESLPEGCEKLRNWYDVKRLDKITYLEIYYEIEIKIN